jgi:hypothetical protein
LCSLLAIVLPLADLAGEVFFLIVTLVEHVCVVLSRIRHDFCTVTEQDDATAMATNHARAALHVHVVLIRAVVVKAVVHTRSLELGCTWKLVLDKGSSPFGAALRYVHGTQARLVKLPFEMGIRRHIALIIKENSGNKGRNSMLQMGKG